MNVRVALFGSFYAVFSLTLAAEPADAPARLECVIEAFHEENPSAPGISAYLSVPAQDLEWAAGVGTMARGSDEPMTADHTFRIASNTKTYTAAATLRLVELGRLELDSALEELLSPGIKACLLEDGYDLRAMTVAQLLSHTSGLADHSADDRYARAILSAPHRYWTPMEQIRLCVDWFDPVGEPGERFSYSDTGYIILGSIIEKHTAKNLASAVRQLLDFDALDLKATYWEYLEDIPESAGLRAHQYFGQHDTFTFHASYDLYGGGGIVADARDIALFVKELIRGGVLGEAMTRAMLERGTPSYRLGLMAVELDGLPAFGHQGFWNTFAFYVPSLNLTVSGCILDHEAQNGRLLAEQLIAAVRGVDGSAAKVQ